MDLLSQLDLASLKVVKFPTPLLQQPSAKVEQFDDDLSALVERMFEVMYASSGVGLAAPQVGVPIRLFVYNPTGRGDDEGVCVNPQLVAGDGAAVEEESCLSLPGVRSKVRRYARVTVRARNRRGERMELSAEGLGARIFQHEIDHLDGVLLVDRMTPVGRLANRRALKDLREQYEDAG